MTTQTAPRRSRRAMPAIIVSETDHRIVTALANSAYERIPDVAETLLDEMDRARVVPVARRPADVVGLGSEIDYVSDAGEARTVRLVMPAEADISSGRISVLTPVGAALIGLSPGQSFNWTGPSGHPHRLTVSAVRPPAA
ncbi:MAG: nucleoside diphosphate kinase regulator [Proteobacteria bacterium]|nr:nucleoside diphosphate kinase regulator [Pseudomonadota bacterium]